MSTELSTEHGWIDTPLGVLYFQTEHGVLQEAGFVDVWRRETLDGEADDTPQLSRAARDIRDALRRYFEGEISALDGIALELRGTPFQRAVWQAIREIPAGRTASYRDIARAVGRPAAVRAVGTATGRNPAGIAVPCHRVVRSDGSLGGYGGGLDRKQWFLDHERAHTGQVVGRATKRATRQETIA